MQARTEAPAAMNFFGRFPCGSGAASLAAPAFFFPVDADFLANDVFGGCVFAEEEEADFFAATSPGATPHSRLTRLTTSCQPGSFSSHVCCLTIQPLAHPVSGTKSPFSP